MKKNKGFSLVELIVVVLIMAIIAVVLAPQVTSWVKSSRISSDKQLMDSAISFSQMALTDAGAFDESCEKPITITVTNDGLEIAKGGDVLDADGFMNKFADYAGLDTSKLTSTDGGKTYKTDEVKTKNSGSSFVIEIDNGKVALGDASGFEDDNLGTEDNGTENGTSGGLADTTPRVSLSKRTISLRPGESETLTATLKNLSGSTASWKSDDTTIATVDASGKVTAVAIGTTSVTAYVGDVTAVCTVIVSNGTSEPETTITLNKTTLSLTVGNSETLTATVTPSKTVTWKSSDTSVAEVLNGKVEAKKAGSTTITATTSDDKTATCAVTVTVAARSYTINYNANGGNGTKAPVTTDNTGKFTTASKTTFTKKNSTLTSWNTQSNGSGDSYNVDTEYTVTADITLYAQWTSNGQYTITFNLDGGEGTFAPITKDKDETATIHSGKPTKAHYDFNYWANGFDHYAPGATYDKAVDVTLTAVWQEKQSWDVTYNLDGGSNGPAKDKKYKDEEYTISSIVPTKNGYKFNGWKSGNKTYNPGDKYTSNNALNLTAQWVKVYRIQYNANGGTGTIAEGEKKKNVAYTLSDGTGLSRDGYTFDGWNTKADGTGTYYSASASYTKNEDLTVYAKWNKIPKTYGYNGEISEDNYVGTKSCGRYGTLYVVKYISDIDTSKLDTSKTYYYARQENGYVEVYEISYGSYYDYTWRYGWHYKDTYDWFY